MSRPIAPLRDLGMRLPTAGRIRLGKKGAKGQPMKLGSFRFTSSDRLALDQIAAAYGGTVKPWSDAKAGAGQFEVITDSTEIRVALPPDPLGGSPSYEMWSGGGCQRRCDGETCEMLVSANDGFDLQHTACICSAKGELECKLTLRLSLLLPDIRFVGTWRIDTHSWNAATEIPGMVEVIQSLQAKGIQRAVLRVEERVQVLAGKTRKFPVPVLGLDASVEQLAAGSAAIGQIGPPAADRLALTTGAINAIEGDGMAPHEEPDDATTYDHADDDEVVDAEVVETADEVRNRRAEQAPISDEQRRDLHAEIATLPDDAKKVLRDEWKARRIRKLEELTVGDLDAVNQLLSDVAVAHQAPPKPESAA